MGRLRRREAGKRLGGDPLQVGLVRVVPTDHAGPARPGLLRLGQREGLAGESGGLLGDPAAGVLGVQRDSGTERVRIRNRTQRQHDEREVRLPVEQDRAAADRGGRRVGRPGGGEVEGRVAGPDPVRRRVVEAGDRRAAALQPAPTSSDRDRRARSRRARAGSRASTRPSRRRGRRRPPAAGPRRRRRAARWWSGRRRRRGRGRRRRRRLRGRRVEVVGFAFFSLPPGRRSASRTPTRSSAPPASSARKTRP